MKIGFRLTILLVCFISVVMFLGGCKNGKWTGPTVVDNGSGLFSDIIIPADGKAIVLWITNGSNNDLMSRNYIKGTGWQDPSLIRNNSSFFNTATDKNGNIIVVGHDFNDIWSYYYTPGNGWKEQKHLETQSDIFLSYDVSMNKNGEAVLIWNNHSFEYLGDEYVAHFNSNEGWKDPEKLPESYKATNTLVNVNSDGLITAVWNDQNNVWLGYSSSPIWYPPVNISNNNQSVMNLNDVNLSVINNTGAVVLWGQNGEIWSSVNGAESERIELGGYDYDTLKTASNSNRVIAVWENIDGIWTCKFSPEKGWDYPEKISTSGQNPYIDMNESGEAVIAWHDYKTEQNDIYASFLTKDNKWTKAEIVGHYNSIGIRKVAIDNKGNAFVIWNHDDGTDWRTYCNVYEVNSLLK